MSHFSNFLCATINSLGIPRWCQGIDVGLITIFEESLTGFRRTNALLRIIGSARNFWSWKWFLSSGIVIGPFFFSQPSSQSGVPPMGSTIYGRLRRLGCAYRFFDLTFWVSLLLLVLIVDIRLIIIDLRSTVKRNFHRAQVRLFSIL